MLDGKIRLRSPVQLDRVELCRWPGLSRRLSVFLRRNHIFAVVRISDVPTAQKFVVLDHLFKHPDVHIALGAVKAVHIRKHRPPIGVSRRVGPATEEELLRVDHPDVVQRLFELFDPLDPEGRIVRDRMVIIDAYVATSIGVVEVTRPVDEPLHIGAPNTNAIQWGRIDGWFNIYKVIIGSH